MKHSLQAQIAEIEREIGLRRDVYPRLVRSAKMRQSVADMHIDVMQAALDTLLYLHNHRDEFRAFMAATPPKKKVDTDTA